MKLLAVASASTAVTIAGSLPVSPLDIVPSMIFVSGLAVFIAGPRYLPTNFT